MTTIPLQDQNLQAAFEEPLLPDQRDKLPPVARGVVHLMHEGEDRRIYLAGAFDEEFPLQSH